MLLGLSSVSNKYRIVLQIYGRVRRKSLGRINLPTHSKVIWGGCVEEEEPRRVPSQRMNGRGETEPLDPPGPVALARLS